jgi:N-acetylglucosamine transport system substrate-binding protein
LITDTEGRTTMDTNDKRVSRRRILQGAVGAAALAPFTGALTSCAAGTTGGDSGAK